MILKAKTIAACSLILCSFPAMAQQEDVTFFVIGKHGNYDQDVLRRTHSVDFSFFSEIFLTADGDASNAILTLPTGEEISFTDQRIVEGAEQDNLFLVRGDERYQNYAALQTRYPDGNYRISFESPSGNVDGALLSFPGDPLPSPPVIEVRQRGELLCGYVDAGIDLAVSWTPFAQGRADELGVLDDLIFVILEDAEGNRVAHSGRPFEDSPYLTFADANHRIDASAMQPGQTYVLSVEHAVLADTHLSDAVPSMTTTAVTTRLRLQTLVLSQTADCDS
jgi:hypothetical protein